MSVKHNVNHHVAFGRGRGHYRDRLEARGLSKAPSLTSLGVLRSRHAARVRDTGQPWPTEYRYTSGPLIFYVTEEGVPLARRRTKADVTEAA